MPFTFPTDPNTSTETIVSTLISQIRSKLAGIIDVPVEDYPRANEILSRSVFLKNLDGNATERDITELFKECGVVKKVTKNAANTAYVEFEDEKSKEKAIELGKVQLKNRQVEIVQRLAVPEKKTVQKKKTKTPSPVPNTLCVDTDLRVPFAPLQTETQTPQDTDLRWFPTRQNTPDGTLLSIFITNMDWNTTEMDVARFFQHCGQIRDICIMDPMVGKRAPRRAFVEFFDMAAKERALQMSGVVFRGRIVTVVQKTAKRNSPPPMFAQTIAPPFKNTLKTKKARRNQKNHKFAPY